MPRFDGTGPEGMGSMTGWGRGYCNPSRTAHGPSTAWRPGYWDSGYGHGFGRGRGYGRGRGFGRGFRPDSGRGRGYGRGLGWRGVYPPAGRSYAQPYYDPYGSPYAIKPEDEVDMLRDEADSVKRELDAINKRIEDLESKSSE